MAVIARRRPLSLGLSACSAILALLFFSIRATCTDDPRARIGYVADSLSANNAAEAISVFDKSFSNYEKLSSYFEALTSSFGVQNDIGILDEQDTQTEAKISVNWTLTLTEFGSDYTERRDEDIDIRLQLKGGKWKIVDFSPITLFNPARNRNPKR